MLNTSLCKKYLYKLIIVYILTDHTGHTIWTNIGYINNHVHWRVIFGQNCIFRIIGIQPHKLRDISRAWYFVDFIILCNLD